VATKKSWPAKPHIETHSTNMKQKLLNLANLGMWEQKGAKRTVEDQENVRPRVNTE
jgi:hypothetical protein